MDNDLSFSLKVWGATGLCLRTLVNNYAVGSNSQIYYYINRKYVCCNIGKSDVNTKYVPIFQQSRDFMQR